MTPPQYRSPYLVNEPAISLYPSLAVALGGADRALMLQQLNYWLVGSRNYAEGRHWIYKTYPEWQAWFPWLSLSTVRRTLEYLEEQGLVLTGSFNKHKTDRTKWYTIDNDAVGRLLGRAPSAEPAVPTAQNEQIRAAQNGSIDPAEMDRSVPKESKEELTKEDQSWPEVQDRLRDLTRLISPGGYRLIEPSLYRGDPDAATLRARVESAISEAKRRR